MKRAPVVSRFAPSPTGRLHLGHAISAIRAHDLARDAGGAFLLRIEDIDGARSRPEHIAGIVEDLCWLGLDWDGDMLLQSTRLGAYAAALDGLRERGVLYPCFCTRADIAASVSAPHEAAAVYPGTCRGLSQAECEVRIAEPHAWRLNVQKALASPGAGMLAWTDSTIGLIHADPAPHGDVVLARKDAPVSYHLAVTIDDAFQRVSDVVRGEDLFAATDVHRLLQCLLGLPTPLYHQHPLLADADGRRLAKRAGAPTLAQLRGGGADPAALVADLRAGRLPVGFAAMRA